MNTEKFINICVLVDKINKSIRKLEDTHILPYGTSIMHLRCLIGMNEMTPGMTIDDLSALCGVERHMIVRIMRDLSANDLCRAGDDAYDGRRFSSRYKPTERGIRVISEIERRISPTLKSLASEMGDDELAKFEKELELFNSAIRSEYRVNK